MAITFGESLAPSLLRHAANLAAREMLKHIFVAGSPPGTYRVHGFRLGVSGS